VAKPSPDEEGDQTVDTEPPRRGAGFSWKKHPSFRVGDVFRLDFQGQFQEDAHASYANAPGLACPNEVLPRTCAWELHRNRIGISGHLFKKIEYEVERELTEQELTDRDLLLGYTPKSPWKDVNINLTYFKDAQITIGKMKIPFSLDQLTGVTHNDFVYRSIGGNYLAPARDIGVEVHGSFARHGFRYWTGVFRHDGDNARSKKIAGGDRTFAGRITVTPFRKIGALSSVEAGTAYTFTNVQDDSFRPNGLRARTVLTQDAFFEPVFVKGRRHRWEADVDWTAGPASARAEYMRVTDDRLRQGLGDEDLPDARYQAWYVSGAWVLTGETKTRPLKARNDFLAGGVGAVELAARYERLWVDSVGGAGPAFRNSRAETILPSGDQALTLGVNWTLNRFIKLQLNAIREHVEDPERNPVPNSTGFWSRVLRLQFVL
jgi:phosphate-selective porin OprO/OprP